MVNHEDGEPPDLGTLAARAAAAMSHQHLRDVVARCKSLARDLRRNDPVRTAASFGGLLLQPTLQMNCMRLEVLVHLSMMLGRGKDLPTSATLLKGFSASGRACGHLEDPPEDVFVGNIATSRGNFMVLEGTWESSTFYLQRIAGMVDELPDDPFFQKIANSIFAMLRLSDLTCGRAGLRRNARGSESGQSVLPKALSQQAEALRGLVRFTRDDLQRAGVTLDQLTPFVWRRGSSTDLGAQSLGHTDLERRPMALADEDVYLVLPTSVSAAIRRYFIEALGTRGNREIFVNRLTYRYARLFAQSPLLGPGRTDLLPFQSAKWGSICGVAVEVDIGLHLGVVFVVDTLEDFHEGGLYGSFIPGETIRGHRDKAIAHIQSESAKLPDFREGVVLVITCGVGRGTMLQLKNPDGHRWKVLHVSAADFWTLGWMREMEPLQLWRLLKAQDQLNRMGVRLQNMNGLLNLFSWADTLQGHLVPHAQLPPEAAGKRITYAIQQNALLDGRHSVATTFDEHVEQFVDGSWRLVRVDGRSHFDDENAQPLYGEFEPAKGALPMGLCITDARPWWFAMVSPEDAFTASYERWRMIGTWCRRSVPYFEKVLGAALGSGPVLWQFMFTTPQEPGDPNSQWGDAADAKDAIELEVDRPARTLRVRIGPGFDKALFNPKNVAESSLVEVLIRGVVSLAGDPSFDLEAAFGTIVPNAQARQSHAFATRQFRDYFSHLDDEGVLKSSSYDDAIARLGLGWKVRSPDQGGRLTGKDECRAYLNALVRRLEDELSERLQSLDRLDTLSKLLLNYEAAAVSRDKWHRTSAAIFALRDAEAALEPMRLQEFKLNAVSHGSRILMEMALCDCPLEGGRPLGRLEHSLLLTLATQIHQLGGWSDLISWGLMEPTVVIRPLGDVHVNHDFIDKVIDQFGSKTSEVRYQASARRYEKNLRMPTASSEMRGEIEDEFLDAWLAEFGVELDAFRRFIDAVEDKGLVLQQPLFVLLRSELEAIAGGGAAGGKIVAAMSLVSRASWRTVPEGHDDRDIASWRFRRRLSILRRPLLQFSDGDDPKILIAPGLLREGFSFTVGNYYEGSFADRHLGRAMRKYAGHASRRDGMGFNTRVLERMRELGWMAVPEIALTKVLAKGFERNYGDVDVLAWDPVSRRVLIMECKDLQFRKTPGEIAEQMTDFAGEVDSRGKPDLLRKHLDRVQVLTTYRQTVARYLGIGSDCSIESHIVFRNPVPMQFGDGPIRTLCTLRTYAELDGLRLASGAGG
jgi:hypothetical protein